MKNMINTKIWLTTIAVALFGVGLIARESPARTNPVISTTTSSTGSYKTEAADCDAPTARYEMEINNVRTTIMTGGDMWWDGANAKYEVPKSTKSATGSSPTVHSLFAGAIWISGKDEGENLKVAAQKYRNSGYDFWSGPLNNAGQVDKATCEYWDKHFIVKGKEIDDFLAGKGIPASIQNWPGRGNPNITDADIDFDLAPFRDLNGDGIYQPQQGEYPVIDANPKCGKDAFSYADLMVFWVFNDVGNVHTQTSGEAIGVQVNALAFAYQTSDELNNMTFYRYSITKKTASELRETYMGQWVDPDMGNFNDDFVGCDTTRDLGIIYNSDPFDEPSGGSPGYGSTPPILGIDYFEGPRDFKGNGLDDDNDGIVDESKDGIDNDGDGQRDEDDEAEVIGMSSFVYFNNGNCAQCDPGTAAQFRNYMVGKWNDGTNITCGGTGYGGTSKCNYVYPGNPARGSVAGEWSECSAGNTGADRRFLQCSGPFTLLPGKVSNITVGVVWVRPPAGAYPCPDFNKYIGEADDKAQALFDNCFKLIDGPDAPDLAIRELDQEINISLMNTSGNNVGERYNEEDALIRNLVPRPSDITYTFEGYKLYQLVNDKVQADDLNDPEKAKLVYQCDVKNGVTKIINQVFNAETGVNDYRVMVTGADKGIVKSFQITEDQFATGERKLVNHKTYYFAAVAYAHNYYELNDTVWARDSISGVYIPIINKRYQQKPYLQGRRNFKAWRAIPHKPDPRFTGTVLNAKYGDMLPITRISGMGNGGNNLKIDSTNILEILASPTAKKDRLLYAPGMAPIKVKVTDPIALKNGKYRVRFLPVDTVPGGVPSPIPNYHYWRIEDATTGNIIAYSSNNITNENEQIITDSLVGNYGFSVSLGQSQPIYTPNYIPGIGGVYGTLNSELIYSNTEKQWLSFIKDDEGEVVENWIRSGGDRITGANEGNANYQAFNDALMSATNTYYDPTQLFEKMLDGSWAPYSLASSWAQPQNNRGALARHRFSNAPGFCDRWRVHNATEPKWHSLNTLDSLQSVMIVITPDKSKWSRCMVLETGENPNIEPFTGPEPPQEGALNNGIRFKTPYKGQLKYKHSVDINGAEIYDDDSIGLSYFPGYAINLETGERLNMAFGEATELGSSQNANDMIWNPSNQAKDAVGDVLWGGKHFIYVFKTRYDECVNYQTAMKTNYNKFSGSANRVHPEVAKVHKDIMYTCIPILQSGFAYKSMADGLVPNEITMYLRVDKPYAPYITDDDPLEEINVYEFEVKTGASSNVMLVAQDALKKIRAVPNPYYGYSGYEQSAVDNRIKITNLPNKCTVTIYSLDGQLIRRFERDIRTETSNGDDELTNAIDWNLKNNKNIPIASGVYLIHVEAPGIGETTIKWFGGLRPTDLNSF